VREVRKAVEFLEGSDDICVIADIDADGVAGAATLREAFDVSEVLFPPGGMYGVPPDMMEEALRSHDLVVTVDLSPPAGCPEPDRVVIVDHHPPDGEPRAAAVVNPHVVPTLGDASASALAGMLAHLAGRRFRPWVPLVGAFGDNMARGPVFETLKGGVDPVYLRGGHGRLNLLQNVAAHVNAARRVMFDEGARIALEVMSEAETPKDVLEDPELSRCRMEVRRETERLMSEAEVEDFGAGCGLATVASGFDVEGILALRLLDDEGMRLVAVYNETPKPCGYVKVSFRSDGSVDAGVVARELASELGGRGGGHREAAAVYFEPGPDVSEAFRRVVSRRPPKLDL